MIFVDNNEITNLVKTDKYVVGYFILLTFVSAFSSIYLVSFGNFTTSYCLPESRVSLALTRVVN